MTMAVFDSSTLASEAYALASSSESIAGLVKEALEVIDAALDEYGCAAHFFRRSLHWCPSYASANHQPPRLEKVSLSFNGGKDCT